jgi:hypothetical protein
VEVGGSLSRGIGGKSTRPYLKNKTKSKRTWGIAQVVEHLPIKNKALSSIPNTAKTNLKKEVQILPN